MNILNLDSLRQLNLRLPFLAPGLASIVLILTIRSSSSSSIPKTNKSISSPKTTLIPGLSKKEIEELPYPPDLLPGARDVTSPYGNVRVYEWGPEDGGKVLLVHGISTPCIALGPWPFLLFGVSWLSLSL